jgi:hypothetical protein
MNRQVLPSMILSVLIVCCFSVLLYHREPRQPRPSPGVGAARPEAISKTRPQTEPAERVASTRAGVAEPAAPKPAAPRATAPTRERPAADGDAAQPAAPGLEPSHGDARSAFTTVKDGETLGDVSIRVYGSLDQAELLWRANRDLLPQRDSALRSGAVLRTPEQAQDG